MAAVVLAAPIAIVTAPAGTAPLAAMTPLTGVKAVPISIDGDDSEENDGVALATSNDTTASSALA